jgi:hypothetical protein
MLALMPVDESTFCEARLKIFETAHLWPLLAGNDSG